MKLERHFIGTNIANLGSKLPLRFYSRRMFYTKQAKLHGN